MANFAAKIPKCLRKIHGPKADGFWHSVFKLLFKQRRHLNELEVEEIEFLEQNKNEEDLSEGHNKNNFFFKYFSIRPPPGLLLVLGPLERYMTPTLHIVIDLPPKPQRLD